MLDSRSQFPATTLADFIMPPVLLAAHQQLDRAVDAACIWASVASPFTTYAQRGAFLFERYQQLVG